LPAAGGRLFMRNLILNALKLVAAPLWAATA
jgi:hypothetical protein